MKILLRDHNNILSDLKPHFELVDEVGDAEVVVVWQDILALELPIVKLAKMLKKPVILIQHGRGAGEDYCPPFDNEMISDKICVWSTSDKEELMGCGIPEKKIEVTGTTIFRHLKGRTPHEGINILFSPEHWDYDIEENIELQKYLEKICKKNKWNLKTKIIEMHEDKNYGKFAVYSNRGQPDHLDIVCDTLAWADVVVSMSEMTLELLAEASDIPIVCYTNVKQRTLNRNLAYLNHYRTYSKAVKTTKKISELEEIIKQQLVNPDELQKERKDIVMIEGGIHIEDPLQRMINVIKNA